jgi:hypothetical protein
MTSGPGGPIEGRVRLHKPYLQIAALGLVAMSIVGLGYLGPHTNPEPTATPETAPAAVATAAEAVTPAPLPAPLTAGIGAVGLIQMQPAPGQVAQSWLPSQVTSRALAVVGMRLFYVVASSRIESLVVGSTADSVTLVTAPRCDAINQIAAAGDELAFVTTSTGGAAAGIGGCGASSSVSWSLWLLDLLGGSPEAVARGQVGPRSIDAAEFPVHVALGAAAYAFDRPTAATDPSQGTTIEVHALDGALLWSSVTQAPVVNVMLGGSRLAVLTGSPSATGLKTLWTSTASQPSLLAVAQPATSGSLSPEGSYVVWDIPQTPSSGGTSGRESVDIEMLDTGRIQTLVTLGGSALPVPLPPAISLTRAGPAIGWLATAPDGSVYPAFRFAGGGDGGILSSFQQPVWMNLEGSTLVWVAERPDGWSTAVYAVDMLSLAIG